MSLKTFLERLLPFLFKAAKREWDKLPKETQDAIKHGSGIIDTLNKEIGKAPEVIKGAIIAKYPDLNEEAVEKGIFKLLHAFNLAPKSDSFEDAAISVQEHFSSLKGKVLDAILQAGANVVAIVLAPAQTVSAKIFMVMEYAYRKYVKKEKPVEQPEDNSQP